MPNIVLITVDSLRYDHLGCYGYHQNTSPNLDNLASMGVRFLEAISNGGQTPQAFLSILASALPPLDTFDFKSMFQRCTTLAELLKKSGYNTAGFHSNPYLTRLYGCNRGFDEYEDGYEQHDPKRWRIWVRSLGKSPDSPTAKAVRKVGQILKPVLSRLSDFTVINAVDINSKVIQWLETHSGEFFVWLHYMDLHHPYMPAAKYLKQFCNQKVSRREMLKLRNKMLRNPGALKQTEIELIINLYDAAIRYVDEAIGMLLNSFGERLSNTLVIVTADHGDEFGEHGKFGHQTVYDTLLRVPLLMAGPGIKCGTVVKQQVSLADLAPTISESAGIDRVSSFQGRSLLPLIKGEAPGGIGGKGVISINTQPDGKRYISYRVPDCKYIRTESMDDADIVLAEEVYDLNNDPGEAKNLSDGDNDEANRFKLEAQRRVSEFKRLKADEVTGYEKQRIKAKLSRLKKL